MLRASSKAVGKDRRGQFERIMESNGQDLDTEVMWGLVRGCMKKSRGGPRLWGIWRGFESCG